MPTSDEQLVQQVVQRVLDALNQRDGGQSGAAPIHPPAGVCTGDYSKFTDRPDLQSQGQPQRDPAAAADLPGTAATATPADAPDTPQTPPGPPPLTGIVTAEQLREAVKASPDGKARLAPRARLTPLANDLVRERPGVVVRAASSPAPASASVSSVAAPVATGKPWLWWASGHCPAVQQLTNDRRDALRPSAARRDEAGLLQVVRDLAAGVAKKDLAGGVLFVRAAARPLLLANRSPALRAVAGHRADALEEAIADLAPNLLVLEYPRLSGELMRMLLDKVLATRPRPSAVLKRELDDLSRLPPSP